MVGENPTPYGILALWAVNGLSIVYWDATTENGKSRSVHKGGCFSVYKVKCPLVGSKER